MIIFLYGSDSFRSKQQLKKMIVKFRLERDPEGLNVISIDCCVGEPGQVLEHVLATPFLAEKRMVILENLLSSSDDYLKTELLVRIEAKSIPETTVLVLWEGTDQFKDKLAQKLFVLLTKEKYSQQFDHLVGVKLSAWLAQEVAVRKGKISKAASQYLMQNIGFDMWRLSSLIDQAIAYKQGQEIQIVDIQLFLDEKADNNIFNLVDAIVAGNAKSAFQMIQEQYRLGQPPSYLFSMILRQFRILVEMRDLYEREDFSASQPMAEKLGLHPFVIKKSLPLMKKYSLFRLKHIYDQLLDLDIKTKTGQGDQSLLLDVFVQETAQSDT